MKKVLISGYYGFDNAGDDTVLFGIINSLRKHGPTIDIAVLSNKPKETTALFGIPAYNRWSFPTILRQLKHSDLLIMGGGSLLQDATSPRSVMYYLSIVMMAKMLKKPVIFFAQGFGPITHPLSKVLIKSIVNKVDVITVRDQGSADDMRSLGVTRPIHITADPAVTIQRSDVNLGLAKPKLVMNEKKSIAISIRKWKNEENYKRVMAQMADEMIRKNWNVYFLPMQYPADVAPSRDIIEYMEESGAVLLDEQMNFQEIISFIGNMDFVIGMRLHSIIIAAVLGVPFVGVSYDPKIDRFIERVNMDSAGSIQSLSYPVLYEVVTRNLDELSSVRERLTPQIEELRHQAEQSSHLAIQLLNRD
ncbi:polysaccharide pyruvyl transferase CsaB [Ammoniphilus sp. CFH 90114]|uniref:polysaccharide pyruvyl transferase CsaB n=1 Tax=Ammoniphilus sp. CFH 90114 TaxID=2493665 RepID=UPI00100FD3F6|nr:polysaccharide pyruvyl transferase CsaB [Ammoniphilus sp. CFH 90114]RXT14645.1 polysaccharide pyruvyl transferase CsaB [Ammoniphilus sp. CFH 90114]